MAERSSEITCDACGRETFLVREPVYEGFTKVGESFRCSSCGHLFEDEELIPYKNKETMSVFTDEDRSEDVKVFEEGENSRLCRYCRHYVINPFMQWCSQKKTEVQATDSCSHFEDRPETEDPEG